jgi:hypothetical protein
MVQVIVFEALRSSEKTYGIGLMNGFMFKMKNIQELHRSIIFTLLQPIYASV